MRGQAPLGCAVLVPRSQRVETSVAVPTGENTWGSADPHDGLRWEIGGPRLET